MWGRLQPARDFSPAGETRMNAAAGGLKPRRRLKPAPHGLAAPHERENVKLFLRLPLVQRNVEKVRNSHARRGAGFQPATTAFGPACLSRAHRTCPLESGHGRLKGCSTYPNRRTGRV